MSLEKIVAVVLAGGMKHFSLREFFHQMEDFFTYKEWYFRRGYKSLKKINLSSGSTGKPKPMVEYILNTLRHMAIIDRIIVVGPENEMREKLDPVLFSAESKIELIQQKESFGHNVKEGYVHAGEKYVLFITSDSPTTKEKDIIEFLEICEPLYDKYDFIYPLVKESLLRRYYRLFPRPFFKMIPDNILPKAYLQDEAIDESTRVGFRITSMAFANLTHVPVDKINEAYNIRKFYRKSTRDKLKKIFGKNLIRRYMQGLKMSDLEKMFSDYEGITLKFIGLSGAGTSLDIDSRRDERRFNNLY